MKWILCCAALLCCTYAEAGPIRRVVGAVCGAASAVIHKVQDVRQQQTVRESKPVQGVATVVKSPAVFIRGGAQACFGGVCEK